MHNQDKILYNVLVNVIWDFSFPERSIGVTRKKDGDIYKLINIEDKTFEIRYGYYEDFERENNDPVPIYPDFLKEPIHVGGVPLVTAMQDACDSFDGSDRDIGCFACKYYESCDDLIGRCTDPKKQI